MSKTNITRRRALQGAGMVGLVGIAGNGIVSAGNGANGAGQGQGSALRVAHASPDAPNVEVRLNEAGATGTTGTGGDGDAGTPTDGGGGGVGEDDAGGDEGEGTPTDGNGTPDGEDGPFIEGIGFREVSGYNEVEPGTYQLQVVATEGTGLIESIFGDDGEEQVVYDEEVEIEAGTTYTAVAFGELAHTQVDGEGVDGDTAGDATTPEATPGDGGDALGDDETPGGTPAGGGMAGDGGALVEGLSFGDHEYVEVDAGDHTLEFRESQAAGDVGDEITPGGDETTPEGGVGDDVGTPGLNETTPEGGDDAGLGDEGTPTPDADGTTPQNGEMAGADRGFQVTVLEDELTVSGDAMAGGDAAGNGDGGDGDLDGDVGNATGDEGAGGGDIGTPNEDGTPGGENGENVARLRVFHAIPDLDAVDVVSVDGDGGDGGLLGGGNETTPDGETPTPGADDEEGTPAGDGGGGEMGEDAPTAQFTAEGGVVYSGFALGYVDPEAAAESDGANGENATDGGDGLGGDGSDGLGDDGTPTPTPGTSGDGTPAGDGEDDGITEDPSGEEFEFVTVEDARDGERADGGSGGGILGSMAAEPAASD